MDGRCRRIDRMSHEFSRDDEHRLYLEGIRLFNAGDFFEAHDTWEEVWHRVQNRRREQFYRSPEFQLPP